MKFNDIFGAVVGETINQASKKATEKVQKEVTKAAKKVAAKAAAPEGAKIMDNIKFGEIVRVVLWMVIGVFWGTDVANDPIVSQATAAILTLINAFWFMAARWAHWSWPWSRF